MANSPRAPRCPSETCSHDRPAVRHGTTKRRSRSVQRWRCRACGRTFTRRSATLFAGLRAPAARIELACRLAVEGMSRAGIARSIGSSWGTVDRWLGRANLGAREISRRRLRRMELRELQFDELRVAHLDSGSDNWIYAGLEVWSRVWTTSFVGTRTYHNTYRVVSDTLDRGTICGRALVTTDGMKYYIHAVQRAFKGEAIHAQVVKSFQEKQLARVDRLLSQGHQDDLDEALSASEDSNSVNTSFVERLNLTLRRSCAYLQRRTNSHPRKLQKLAGQLDLMRCWYNFIRPHQGLKFGGKCRTPAQQAGLAKRPLRFLDLLREPIPPPEPMTARLKVEGPGKPVYAWQLGG